MKKKTKNKIEKLNPKKQSWKCCMQLNIEHFETVCLRISEKGVNLPKIINAISETLNIQSFKHKQTPNNTTIYYNILTRYVGKVSMYT